MKLYPVSDLHLCFSWTEFPGDANGTLIVAGDTCEVRNSLHMKEFLDENSYKFKYVILVLGNHEFYGSEYHDTIHQMETLTENYRNVFFLNDQTVCLDGIKFIGSTLWTDFNKGNVPAMEIARYGMNDFRMIKYITRKFTPEDAYNKHIESLEYLISQFKNLKNERIVVITHHAPSEQSISSRFYGNSLNPAYYSDLEYLMDMYSQVRYWFHGHIHSSSNYMINQTRVICNPKGYNLENLRFDPNLFVEI